MTFRDLKVGDRFTFVGEYGDDYDWLWHTKTGPRTYRDQRWSDGSGGDEGAVGIGDNPVYRKSDEGKG